MRRIITWNMSGLQDQNEAEQRLAVIKDWFKISFKADEWEVDASIENGPWGWRASLEAVYKGVTQ